MLVVGHRGTKEEILLKLKDIERFVLPALRKLGTERVHDLAVWYLRVCYPRIMKLLKVEAQQQVFPSLKTEVFGLPFATPLGMAAGDDKKAEIFLSLLHLGFSSVEIGTFTPRPQCGNPKPRWFYSPADESLVNRMGLNNCGFDQAEKNLRSAKNREDVVKGIVGVSIGPNTGASDEIADYVDGVVRFSGLADYLVLNLSCPNVVSGHEFRKIDVLKTLLQRISEKRDGKTPLLLKIAPDLKPWQEEAIAKFALDGAVDGLVVSNTVLGERKIGKKMQLGSISGRPLFKLSTQKLERMYKLTKGSVPLIGVGGIFTAEDAYAKILAGASLVQLYTALTYKGSGVVDEIHEGLVDLLKRDGYKSISDAVGQGVSCATEQEHDALQERYQAVA